MDFTYKIKGIELNMLDMNDIHAFYETACTCECLEDLYNLDRSEAWKLAEEVRERMAENEISESDAIIELGLEEE